MQHLTFKLASRIVKQNKMLHFPNILAPGISKHFLGTLVHHQLPVQLVHETCRGDSDIICIVGLSEAESMLGKLLFSSDQDGLCFLSSWLDESSA